MLEIVIPGREMYNERTGEFINLREQKVQLEHSLISLSKWEAKWKKPFLSEDDHSREELLDYLRCMCLTPNVDPLVFETIPLQQFEEIKNYISEDQTATKVYDRRISGNYSRKKDVVTSELIYYMMIFHGIPFECQKWHLSRLLMLIRVCSVKGSAANSMSQKMIMDQNRALNNKRKMAMHSKG